MGKIIEHLEEAIIRFAGDSGDGMQLVGTQFSDTSGFAGNEVNTFPDYPSEIRAPESTLYGASAFHVHFGKGHIRTTGDFIDVPVAMNAASLKVNKANFKAGGIVLANTEGFDARNLALASYASNPLEDGSLAEYTVYALNMAQEIMAQLSAINVPAKTLAKTKNIFALGITYWLFNRPLEPTVEWINSKFKGKDDFVLTNVHVLRAGWNFAEWHDLFQKQYVIDKRPLPAAIAASRATKAYRWAWWWQHEKRDCRCSSFHIRSNQR